MCNINDNAVHAGLFVRKSFNVKNYCTKYFVHEIFVIYGSNNVIKGKSLPMVEAECFCIL